MNFFHCALRRCPKCDGFLVDEVAISKIGVAPVTKRVGLPLAYAVGAVMEAVWSVFGLNGEPRMTRFVAAQLCTSHHYDLTAARRDFGYELLVSDEEAHQRTVTWLQGELSAGRL